MLSVMIHPSIFSNLLLGDVRSPLQTARYIASNVGMMVPDRNATFAMQDTSLALVTLAVMVGRDYSLMASHT